MSTEISPPANGSGPDKPFVLSKVKSPGELARERMAREMPAIRREVNRMDLPIPAKWLFDRISDDNFWDVMGGDGFGSVCTTVKNISQFYRHKRDTVARALECAIDAGVLWVERSRGYIVIHISALVPPPRNRVQPMARAMARASRAIQTAEMFHVEQLADGDVEQPIRAPSTGTDKNLSESQQNDDSCPQKGQAVPHLRARRARSTGTLCPFPGHSVPVERARTHENDPIRAPSTGTPCPQDGHVMPAKGAQPAPSTGTKSEKSSMKSVSNPLPNISPSINSQSVEDSLEASRVLDATKAAIKTPKTQQIIEENQFLKDVAEVVILKSGSKTRAEMENFGRCWRLAFRTDPSLARKTLDEIHVMVREGRIRESPSAAAFAGAKGVWEILGGGKIRRHSADAAAAKRQNKKEKP